jgi:hypothetical protein
MGARRFTKDEVEILITYTAFFYNQCLDAGETFKGKDKYEVIQEIIKVIKSNEKKLPNLRLV